MFGLGMGELIAIGCIVFLLFGGTILRKFSKNTAEAIRETRKAIREISDAQITEEKP